MTEEMKPSGIAWIGDIPAGWKVKKVKYVIQNDADGIKVGPFGSALTNEVVSGEEGQYKIYGQANLIRKDFDYGDNFVTEENYRRLINYEVLPDDIAVSMMGTIGKCSVVPHGIKPGIMDSHLIKIRLSNKMNPRFFEYVYESCVVYEQLVVNSKGSIMNGLNSTIVKSVFLAVPLIDEQVAITDFLDAQCAKIDSVIEDIEKQIETLQKYKKSLITETVTKGLERSVPMKDSEIEWIGEIPSHWGTNRLRYVSSVKTGPFGTQLSADEYVDEGVPIINVKNIGYGSILAEDLDFVPETVADRLSAHRLKTDDIVFGRKGAVDKHAIITDEYVNWVQGSDCIRVRSNPEIDSGYLNYLFDSTYFGSYVMLYAVGATMPSMSSDILLNARILVPPVHEQKDIATYLDSQCGKINAIIANKQTQLDTIQSHRKSLIYEYVTGKKRVTEVN